MPELKASFKHVGIPIIDEQHKNLIDVSNGLLQAMINGMGNEVIEDIITELRDYTRYHFETEEAYMKEIGYPGYDTQYNRHRQLMAEVDVFSSKLLCGESVSPGEVLDFINKWLVQHIQEMDSKIGEFARKTGKV